LYAHPKRKSSEDEGDVIVKKPRLDYREATLVLNREYFKSFPVNDKGDFAKIRSNPAFAYFDRTRYITILDSYPEDVLLFLRPRRFGKSLTVSMLAHFHGVEHKYRYEKLFKDLDVDGEVQAKRVVPGQYLVLSFNFAEINRSKDIKVAEASLNDMINNAIKRFYRTYAPYLGNYSAEQLIERHVKQDNAVSSLDDCVSLVQMILKAVNNSNIDHPLAGVKGIYLLADEYDAFSNEYLDPHDHTGWNHLKDNQQSLLKGIWALVKGSMGTQRIEKCFITGVSPLSMADHTSGFNIATNVTFKRELSGLCGLSHDDVKASLGLWEMNLASEVDVIEHLEIMMTNFDGYRFNRFAAVEPVFNTNTCLDYLQRLKTMDWTTDPTNPSNSEVSERTLQVLAASPVAIGIIEEASKLLSSFESKNQPVRIRYEELRSEFRMVDLRSDITNSKPTWLSFMLYVGGLTFAEENPKEYLQIPNLVASKRFIGAVLDRYNMRATDVDAAMSNIASDGDVRPLLGCYRRLMVERDVGDGDLNKSEEIHRDSIHYVLLKNPLLNRSKTEFVVTKSSGTTGRIDLLIKAPPSSSITVIIEFKVVRIQYLDVALASLDDDSTTTWKSVSQRKASTLRNMVDVDDVLNLKFARHDRFNSGRTIRQWVKESNSLGSSPALQLLEYWNSAEILKMRESLNAKAYLVIIIGSRKILLWPVDDNAGTLGDPELVGE
jgi:hypothetical protein